MQRRRLVALYGGTFDPVHVGHISVAETLLTLFGLDEILFIPAHTAPHKRSSTVTPGLHRYAMLALATQQDPAKRISTVELDAPEKPYTVDTLAHFRSSKGNAAALFFVMGADSWSEIASWHEWEKLVDFCSLIIFTRPGFPSAFDHVPPLYKSRIIDIRGAHQEDLQNEMAESAGHWIYVTDAICLDVSATEIRHDIRDEATDAWTTLVPPVVAAYITKYRLYREGHERDPFNAGTGVASPT